MPKFGLMAICPCSMEIYNFAGYEGQPTYIDYLDFFRETLSETDEEFVVCPAPVNVIEEYYAAAGLGPVLTAEVEGMTAQ